MPVDLIKSDKNWEPLVPYLPDAMHVGCDRRGYGKISPCHSPDPSGLTPMQEIAA